MRSDGVVVGGLIVDYFKANTHAIRESSPCFSYPSSFSSTYSLSSSSSSSSSSFSTFYSSSYYYYFNYYSPSSFSTSSSCSSSSSSSSLILRLILLSLFFFFIFLFFFFFFFSYYHVSGRSSTGDYSDTVFLNVRMPDGARGASTTFLPVHSLMLV